MGVMSQTVEGGVGHHGIRKQGHPVLRGAVTGDDERGLEVALRHDLIKVFGLHRVERRQESGVSTVLERLAWCDRVAVA